MIEERALVPRPAPASSRSAVLIAELFQTTLQNVNLHLKNIYEEGELDPAANHQVLLDGSYREHAEEELCEAATCKSLLQV